MRLLELSPVQQRKVRTLAKYSNTVEYQIRTTLDSSGIAKLKAELATLQNSLVSKNAQGLIPDNAFRKTMADIKQVDNALTKAFNGKLGMLDIKKFNSELTKGNQTLNSYYKSFSSLGSQGTRAFGQMYGQLTKIDTGMKQVSSTTDKIANTFGNTFRWGVIASMFSGIMNSIHQSVQYVKDLDKSLTNIQMVTASSREAMNDFAVQANEAAKRLGGTTVQMTNATEVFIRQGHSLQTSTQLGEYAVHLANVSGQDSAMASDEITAYMNAFHISVDDIGNAVSKWAAVANNAAVSVEELSVASQKAAAVATTVGVDMDQFAAHIAAIEATTREAPENIGNGLKTLYSRIADISLGETLEDGVNMGSFAKAIEKVGVEVLDDAGKLRDAGDIIQDLMGVWQDLDQTQRAALAKTVAGRFQLARFEALMNSADIYEKSLKTSQQETGTEVYDRMQETYRDSMEGRLNALSATIEGIFTKAFDTDDFYGLIDAATLLAETFDNLIQSIGGGSNALLGLGAIITKVFSKNIAQGIGNSVLNRQTNQLAKENLNTQIGNAQAQLRGQGLNTDNQYMNNMANNIAKVQQYMGNMSQEQLDKLNASAQKHIGIMSEAAVAEKEFQSVLEAVEIGIRAEEVSLEGAITVEERYAIALKEMAQAKADGVSYNLQESEMYQALTSDVEKLARGLVTLTNAFENNVKAGNINADTLKQMQTQAAGLNGIIQELIESEKLDEERVKELSNAQKILTQIEQGQITSSAELTEALNAISLSEEHFLQTLKNLNVNGKDAQIILEQLKIRFEQTAAAAEVSAKEMQGMAEMGAVQNLANNISNIASGAMSIIFAFQSIRSVFEALGNDELNPFEKIEQTLMGLSMAAMMTVPVIMQLRGAYLTLSAAESANVIAQKANNMAQWDANVLIKESIGQKGFYILATKAATAATDKEKIAILKSTLTKKEYTIQEVAAIAATTGLTVEQVKQTIAAQGGTVANIGLGNALKILAIRALEAAKAFGAWLIAHPIILAVAGAVAAVVAVLKLSYDAWNADANAMANAAKAAEEANTKWKETKETVENLTSSLEELNKVSNALDELTTGTEEWNEKLKENNDLVLELLSNYPELSKYIERTEKGQLKISKNGQQEILAQANNQELAARNAKYSTQIAYNQAKSNNEETDTAREMGLTTIFDWSGKNTINALVDYMEKNNKSSSELTEEDISRALSTLGWGAPSVEQVINSIKNNGDKLDIIAGKKEAYDTSNKLYFDEMMLSQNESYDPNSSYANKMYEDYLSILEERQRLDEGLDTELLAKRYADLAGYDSASFHMKDGVATLSGLDGKTIELTREQLQKYVPALEAVNETTNKAKDYQEEYNQKIQVFGEDMAKIIKTNENGKFAGFDFSTMSQNDIANINETIQDWATSHEDVLQRIGFADAKSFIDAFQKYIKENPPKLLDLKDLASEFSRDDENIKKVLEDAGLTEEQLDDYINQFKQSGGAGTDDNDSSIRKKTLIEENNQIKKQIDLAKKYQQKAKGNAKETERWQNTINMLNQELADNEKEIKEVAIDMLETTNAAKALSESWEEWNNQIHSTDPAAQAAGYNNLKQVLASLLNINVSAISDDLIHNSEILAELGNVANGDVTAIERLRIITSDPIIQQINLDNHLTDETINELKRWRDYAIQALPDIEVGAYLDDGPFIRGLQNMIVSGKAAVNDINTVLESIGYDIEVSYRRVPINARYKAASTQRTAAELDMAAATQALTPDITLDGYVDIPIVTAKRKPIPNVGSYGSSNGGSKGGSGGGGGGSKSTGSEKDVPTNEKDIYEKVNTTLNKIESDMSDLNRQQDNLAEGGIRWLAVLETEKDTLQEQVKTLREKRKIQESEKDSYATQLTNIAKQVDVDSKNLFDDNGQYKGYSATWDAINRKIQAAYNKYNAIAEKTSPEDLKPLEDEITKWEKVLQDFDKAYQGFDQLYSTDIPNTIESIREAEDAIGDLGESIFKAKRESAKSIDEWIKDFNELNKSIKNVTGQHIKIDFEFNKNEWNRLTEGANNYINTIIKKYQDLKETADKTQKAWLDAQIKLLKDVKNNGKSSLLNYVQQQIADVENMWNQYNKKGSYIITDANGVMYESTDENFLKEISESAMEDAQNIASQLGDVLKNQLEGLNSLVEDMNDNLDDTMDKYDTMSEQIDHIQEMYELFNGDKPDQSIVDAYNQQAVSEEKRLYALEQSKIYYSQITQQYKELLALDPKNLDYQKALREAQEKERDIDSQILDTRKEIVEKYKEARDEANKLALANWSNLFKGNIDMGNGTSVAIPLKEAADQWERIKEQEAFYLDDLNKAAEIQKLQNKYQDLLNNATDPMIQKQITEQMKEQLEYLREKDKLSEYDVKYANAQLEILQKTIALEDARAAKNTMKLRRDSQGNYQYVYAADQNDILNKQNDLLSANLDAYNMSKEHQNDVQGQMIDKIIDMVDKITSVMTNDELTAEEQDAEIRHIIDTNYYLLNGLYEQLSDSQKKMIDSFIKGGSLISDENSKGIADTIQDLLDGTLNNLDNVDETFTTFVKSWIGPDGKFIGEGTLKDAADIIKNNLSGYETRTDDWTKEIENATTAVTRMTNATNDLIKNLKTNANEFKTQNTSLKEWTQTLTEANNVLQKMLDKFGSSSIVGSSYVGDTAAGLGKKSDKEASILGNLTTNPPSATDVVRKGSTVKYNKDGNKYKVLEIDKNRTNKDGQYKIDTKPNPSWVTIDKIKVLQYKTGGYTGFWNGPDIEENGRLAFLHQKELVLNSTDTQNILAAVDAVRNITDRLKISNFANSMAAIGKVTQNAISGNNIQQRVEITANFPSVTSSKEIENALLNLSDTAYQYAYNKNNIPW